MEAFEADGERRFARAILAHVAAKHPAKVAGVAPAVLERRALAGIARARALGIPREAGEAVALYVVLMFTVGPDFDRHPRCGEVLGDASLPPEARVFSLIDARSAIPWAEVARGCRPDAWDA